LRNRKSKIVNRKSELLPSVLILTPVKDAAEFLDGYFAGLYGLSYPRELISIGFLEGDSDDDTYAAIERRLPELGNDFRRAGLWKRDFGFKIPPGVPRYAEELQIERRSNLAKSRNHLLFRALDDEEWVLWIDVDVVEYPADILTTMLATGREIVHPNCVIHYGGESFDRNAWRDDGRLHMHDLRVEGDLVPLHSVGGTMLLVKADLHRDGLIFPPFPYGLENPLIRTGNAWRGEIETEGFGIMAADMGVQCWGMPRLEIRHREG
jgi:Anp1